ncbi:MAG: SAP domain-containing protein [Deltaproteobacteria bacterium]|nr:SAP domain-containing protein [Deltaproteobacteria bacterium]
MKFKEIQLMAKDMGISTFRMKKTDVIRAIQREENNIDCFGTSRVEHCGEQGCLWRNDCVDMNERSGVDEQ